MSNSDSNGKISLSRLVQQVSQDLRKEISARGLEIEFDLIDSPLLSQHGAEPVRQALSIIFADSVGRSAPGDHLLVTLVFHQDQWEVEIADARSGPDDADRRSAWLASWPPLQKAMSRFGGRIELRRCAQGGWAVTLGGDIAKSLRASA